MPSVDGQLNVTPNVHAHANVSPHSFFLLLRARGILLLLEGLQRATLFLHLVQLKSAKVYIAPRGQPPLQPLTRKLV